MNNVLANLSKQNPVMLAGAALLVVAGVYFLSRKAVADVANAAKDASGAVVDTVTGVATGNNALTKDTPYEGAGVLGTVGAATNNLLGGVPQRAGEYLGGWIYDLLHSDE